LKAYFTDTDHTSSNIISRDCWKLAENSSLTHILVCRLVVTIGLLLPLRLGPFLICQSTLSTHSINQVVLCFAVRATLL
jgi:hypothetical protein